MTEKKTEQEIDQEMEKEWNEMESQTQRMNEKKEKENREKEKKGFYSAVPLKTEQRGDILYENWIPVWMGSCLDRRANPPISCKLKLFCNRKTNQVTGEKRIIVYHISLAPGVLNEKDKEGNKTGAVIKSWSNYDLSPEQLSEAMSTLLSFRKENTQEEN